MDIKILLERLKTWLLKFNETMIFYHNLEVFDFCYLISFIYIYIPKSWKHSQMIIQAIQL